MIIPTAQKSHGEALLTHLLFISRRMAEMRSLKPLLAFAVDEILHLVGAEQGFIVLLQDNGELDYRVKRRIDGIDIEMEADPISHSILQEAIQTQKSVLVRNALTDPRFSGAMSVMILQLRSIMCVPLITKSRAIGALYVENRSKAGRFAEENLTTLEFFSAQASVAIENANLNDRNLELLEAVRDLNASLEQRVAERNAELRTAQQHIITQEKLASLGVLTAGVAHELRNPLNFIKNYAEASLELSEELTELLPALPEKTATAQANLADLIENMQSIRQHSSRAEKVIQNMTQHAHLDIDQAPPQPTNLNELVEQAVRLAYHSQRAQNTQFNFAIRSDYAEVLPSAEVVAANFNRVIINLVENACDAMRKKHTQLNTEQEANYKPALTIRTRAVNEAVEVLIEDNGAGIPPAIQPKIFDPFFTTKLVGEGVGLGLYIAHDIIVNQHHGRLTFESQENEFTKVLIRVPLRQNNPVPTS